MKGAAQLIAAAFVVLAAVSATAYREAYRRAQADIAKGGAQTLALSAAALDGAIGRYRTIPDALAEIESIRAVAGRRDDSRLGDVDVLLERLTETLGARDIYVMGQSGITATASNWRKPRSFIGRNFAYRPYFQDAINTGAGVYFALGTTSGERGFYFSRRVDAPGGAFAVIVVKAWADAIEAAWGEGEAAGGGALMALDRDGVIFMSNRPEMLMHSVRPLPEAALARIERERRYDGRPIRPLPPALETSDGVLRFSDPAWRGFGLGGGEAIEIASDLLPVGLRLVYWADSVAARRRALEAALLAGAGALAAALAVGFALQRRAALRQRIALEATAKETLERRVEERTEDLRRAQADLVQASKLSALGQMSAGISHELNQPLAAIRTYAENAGILLERGRMPEAAANLTRIGEMTERAARIIRNLRTFARKESGEVAAVSPDAALADALQLLERRIGEEGVAIVGPEGRAAMVMGGRVRLGQVYVNILANAMDAMRGQAEKRIVISHIEEDGLAGLAFLDSGPGLSPDALERLFDPFFTTKQADEGQGLGLGLSISYGVIGGFGGRLSARSHESGGAEFRVLLRRAEDEGLG